MSILWIVEELVIFLKIHACISRELTLWNDRCCSPCTACKVSVFVIELNIPVIANLNLNSCITWSKCNLIFCSLDYRSITCILIELITRTIVKTSSVMVNMNFDDVFWSRAVCNLKVWSPKSHTSVHNRIRCCKNLNGIFSSFNFVCLWSIVYIITFFT